MPTQNKEVLRIRAIRPSLGTMIHWSGKGPHANQYRCPPKDFKVLRAERKARWSALKMWERTA